MAAVTESMVKSFKKESLKRRGSHAVGSTWSSTRSAIRSGEERKRSVKKAKKFPRSCFMRCKVEKPPGRPGRENVAP